jgi:spore maturation protein SpmB
VDWGSFFSTALKGGLKLSLLVFVILVPLLIALEFMRQTKALGWLTDKIDPLTAKIGFKREALVPLLAGFLFGISYGAGVLIPEARSKLIDKRQIFLVAVFLALCHAVVEDTLLFMAVGANGAILFFSRLILALGLTYLTARLMPRLKLKELSDA